MSLPTLTIKNIAAFVTELIAALYAGTYEEDGSLLTEDAVWFSPYQEQPLSGRAAITEAINKKELVTPAFLGPIYTKTIALGKKHCITVSDFERTLTLPDGIRSTAHLRCQLSWVMQETWRIAVANAHQLCYRSGRSQSFVVPQSAPDKRLMLREKGTDNTIFIRPSLIEWVENDSHYSTIHLQDQVITVGIELRDLAKACEGILIPCHASYLVNPLMVISCKRFSLTLQSGTTLPIPEKRFTTVKKQLTDFSIK